MEYYAGLLKTDVRIDNGSSANGEQGLGQALNGIGACRPAGGAGSQGPGRGGVGWGGGADRHVRRMTPNKLAASKAGYHVRVDSRTCSRGCAWVQAGRLHWTRSG